MKEEYHQKISQLEKEKEKLLNKKDRNEFNKNQGKI